MEGHLTLERQLDDGTWEVINLPIVNMVCYIPHGIYSAHNGIITLPGGVYLRGPGYQEVTINDNSGDLITWKPRQRKNKTKEPFWCKKWK